jgi:Ca-activated chloride channel family protein
MERTLKSAATALCAALALGCGDDDAGFDSAGNYVVPDDTINGPGHEPPATGSNVSFGGSQDIGFMRGQLEAGMVPALEALDSAGFFAEHFIETPAPACGERVCVQPMVGVMRSLTNDEPMTMLHVGLKSPIEAGLAVRPPLDLAVVVDVSGSMQGQKMEYTKQGLELLVDGMRDGDRLALISYSDGAAVLGELLPVEEQRAELRRAIRGLVARGGTNIAAGLELGYLELLGAFDEASAGRERRVILLSDGVPTVGNTFTPDILELSASYNSEGIGLSTIGLGSDFNIELMRGLSLQGDGNFYFVEDAGAVNEVFEEELSFFLVPVALDLELTVRTGDSYELLDTYGAPLWQDTSDGGEIVIPSVFLAHRESADDVTEDDGRRGGGSSLIARLVPRSSAGDARDATIATVSLSFLDPETHELVQDTVELGYPEPLHTLRDVGYFAADDVADAHKSFLMFNIFVGMERAIGAFHARQADAQTIAELDRLIAAVEDYNQELEDKDIELDLELLEMLRANMLRAGIRSRTLTPRADPWPCD